MTKNCKTKIFAVMDDSASGRGIMNINVKHSSQPKITFIIDKSNFLYGVDKLGKFCIGLVDEAYNVNLFKVNRDQSTLYFWRKLSVGNKFNRIFDGVCYVEYEKDLSSVLDALELGEVNVTGELFANIPKK